MVAIGNQRPAGEVAGRDRHHFGESIIMPHHRHDRHGGEDFAAHRRRLNGGERYRKIDVAQQQLFGNLFFGQGVEVDFDGRMRLPECQQRLG